MWAEHEGRVLGLLKERRTAVSCDQADDKSRRAFQGLVSALRSFERMDVIRSLKETAESESGNRYVVMVQWRIVVDAESPGFNHTQWRTIVLRRFYCDHGSALITADATDFAGLITQDRLDTICSHLAEKQWLDWTAILSGGGVGRITATGIDEIEGRPKESALTNFSIGSVSAQNIQIGNDNALNAQSVSLHLQSLIQAIDNHEGSAEEKAEAKSRLKSFLEHPLTASALGAVIPGILALLA